MCLEVFYEASMRMAVQSAMAEEGYDLTDCPELSDADEPHGCGVELGASQAHGAHARLQALQPVGAASGR